MVLEDGVLNPQSHTTTYRFPESCVEHPRQEKYRLLLRANEQIP